MKTLHGKIESVSSTNARNQGFYGITVLETAGIPVTGTPSMSLAFLLAHAKLHVESIIEGNPSIKEL